MTRVKTGRCSFICEFPAQISEIIVVGDLDTVDKREIGILYSATVYLYSLYVHSRVKAVFRYIEYGGFVKIQDAIHDPEL